MRIYIDEAGPFVAPPSGNASSYSLVLALSVPSVIEKDLFYEFLRLRDRWSNQDVEIKGSKLDESQAASLIQLVSHFDVLVNYLTIDMAMHRDEVIDDFKLGQADELTAHLTQAHHRTMVTLCHDQADAMRAMSNQLFLQAFLTIRLVMEVIREATLYFVQRSPQELAEIAWFIDRKNRTMTEMETMWTEMILPASEFQFAKNRVGALIGADYSYFYERYGYRVGRLDARMEQHLKWMEEVYAIPPPAKGKTVIDAKRLLSERREFVDSRDSLGVQLADMLASILRRALNDRLQYPGWKDFGKLVVRKQKKGSSILQLGKENEAPMTLQGHPKKVCLVLDAMAKSMLTD